MGQLGDIEKIVDQPRHHFPRIVFVIIGKREPLEMAKEVLAHIGFHSGAHDMPPVGNKILAKISEYIKGQQKEPGIADGLHNDLFALGEKVFAQIIEDLGEGKVHSRDDYGTEHIRIKKKAIRFIVAGEFGH